MTQEYTQTYLEVDGDGSNNKPFQFPTIHRTDVKVSVDGAAKTSPTHYNIIDYTPTGGGKIQFTSGNIPTSGQKILIYRDTPIGLAKSTYSAGSSVRDSDLNNNQKQFLHVAQEIEEDIADISVRQRFFVSSTPPADPINGAFWYDPVSGRAFVYYTDVDSPQWVESNPAFGGVNTGTTDITNLTDANIAGNANISQSKLNLAITNSEVDANAAIAKSKLANLDIANADVASNAAIAKSKLADLDIVNADVNASAAIDATKISYKHSDSDGQARTLASRLESIINIKDFIPTSVTDTSASTVNCATYINNAIDALPSTGGKIIFPPGLYRLASQINITKNAVALEGACGMVVASDNFGARFIRDNGDNNTFIKVEHARSTQVRNIGFIGGTYNGTNTGGAGVKPANGAIHVDAEPGTQEHIYENLTFNGITFCINFDGLSSSLIRNCKFRQVPEASTAADSHVIKLHGSSSTDRADQIRIVDCIIDGSPAPGLGASAWSNSTTYTINNLVESDKERVYKVVFAPNAGTTSPTAPTGTGNYITGNTDNNGATTLAWAWQGNKINRTVRGIYIDADVSTVFISRTSVIRCRDNYYVTGTWQGNFINFENAEAERAAYDGFNISSQAPNAGSGGNFITIADCFAGTNYEQGINLNTDQDSTVQISNVNCRDNRQNGILINSDTENVSITNPTIGGNGSSQSNYYNGISIASSSNHVYISGGKCGGSTVDLSGTGPQKYGIQVNGNNHDHIVILGVDVSGNQTGGIEWATDNGSGNINANNDNFIQFCPGYSTGQTTFP
mgnify:CR=1 FL=1